MAALDAESSDKQIDRPANRKSETAQEPIVRGGLDSQFRINQRHDFKFAQRLLDEPRFRIGAQPLQYLAEDKIADQQFLSGHQ